MRFCWSQILFIFTVILLGLASMLSACGKKGGLYLPTENTEPVAKSTAPLERVPEAAQSTVEPQTPLTSDSTELTLPQP